VTDTSYAGARALFAAAGVPFTAAVAVHGPAELETAFEDGLAFPLVLKATGRQHKSDGGGVVLGLRDADQARAAYATMLAELDPPAVSVEPMVDTSRGVEVIVGCLRDPRFGPVLVVGVGGVFTEVLADTALAIAPVSAPDARRLLLALRAAPLLLGARGREPVDLDALADVVSRVSQVAAAHPELVEVELNPVLARAAGAVALDARVVLEEPGQSPATSRR
jgi:acyl-CoA synthetase (NDP forming)